ncbi:hypothetical protein HPB50_006406 [Hyalomma asiaticum]|uniref:Uncharacterized protein n=1 Tax=Hyalomma asiaticum TaxID=266040 RepID=A0ACB7SCQ5_HYAAI|nr:hypothetical protein HPB50_006406 [Hyalomma asiaticum]
MSCERVCVCVCSHGRWLEETLPKHVDQNIRQSFRVSAASFKYLVNVFWPNVEHQATNLNETVRDEAANYSAIQKISALADETFLS